MGDRDETARDGLSTSHSMEGSSLLPRVDNSNLSSSHNRPRDNAEGESSTKCAYKEVPSSWT